MTRIVFLDTETTGLNPAIHDVWEIGIIGLHEHQWLVQPDLTHADPAALDIGRYWERTAEISKDWAWQPTSCRNEEIANEVARLLQGAVIVGSNPGFDQAFLTQWLSRYGQVWAAHYRPVDVITLGAGRLIAEGRLDGGAKQPYSSTAVSNLFGINPDDYDRHTALGDCQWVQDLYEVITGSGGES